MASLPFDLPLHTQRVTPSSPETKIRLSLLATAMVDALGGPAEFRPRFSFDFISALLPNDNFGLPPGVWTDDTSMTLCLARSLATVGAFDEGDQLDAYLEWWSSGTLSATGECFDIGNTTQRALSIYEDARNEVVGRRKAGIRQLVRKVANRRNTLTQAEKSEAAAIALPRIRENMSGESCGGNGSLMRVLPVALAYWRDAGVAQAFARRSSETTHPNPACAEACEVWTGAIARVLQAATTPGASLTKLDVLHYFATFPYVTDPLRAALASDVAFGPSQSNVDIAPEEMEAHYAEHHRLLRLRHAMLAALPRPPVTPHDLASLLPTAEALQSKGYVVYTLVAALYAFLATQTFEDGAMLVVNMGSDADTVGAVYAGLAACWYACADCGAAETGLFWTTRV
ncbi:ADP-ribosylation/Crystallin J1, partial [Mycena sp. CBHHK59/15]